MTPLILASCATAPPEGQPCNDTVALGPIPDWVWLGVLGVIAAVTVVALLVSWSRRRSRREPRG